MARKVGFQGIKVDIKPECPVIGRRVHYPIFGGRFDGCTLCLPIQGRRGRNEHLVYKDDLYVILNRPVTLKNTFTMTLTAVYQGHI